MNLRIAGLILFALFALTTTAAPASAQTISIEPDADAEICTGDAGDHFYNDPSVHAVYNYFDVEFCQAHYRFDSRPAATLATLTLPFFVDNSGAGGEVTVSVFASGTFAPPVLWADRPARGDLVGSAVRFDPATSVEIDITAWWNSTSPALEIAVDSASHAYIPTDVSLGIGVPVVNVELAPEPSPTPTPEPTAITMSSTNISLPSGGVAVVEMRASAGELCIVGLLILLVFILLWPAIGAIAQMNSRR